MAEPTGTIHESFGGKDYALQLTFRGIATLQEKYGNNIAGLLDNTAGDIPAFAPLLDLVSLALQKGSKLSAEDADEVSESMLTADTEIVGRIIGASFPEKKRVKPRGKKAA
tara:strand:- start:4323 stop:4655 length:333 start_codon:yes stop_codon:yes gene_type:complete